MRLSFILLLLLCFNITSAQNVIQIQVIDLDTTIPIAFAKINYSNKNYTTNWQGEISIPIINYTLPITTKYKGYYTKTSYPTKNVNQLLIKLTANPIITDNEIYTNARTNAIIKKVISEKKNNQPEKKITNFQYKNYEYLKITANPDSISSKIDTVYKKRLFSKNKIKIDSSNYKIKKIIEQQHLYQTEKITAIQHSNKGTKEIVLATRMAGFKQPIYEVLGVQLTAASVYENPFKIMGKPLQNPISKYGRRLYNFTLLDTVLVDNRKAYRIYFQPKKLQKNRLRGILFIDVENYAIAKAHYRVYGKIISIADYYFSYLKEYDTWFPKEKNITIAKGSGNKNLKLLGETIILKPTLNPEEEKTIGNQIYLNMNSVVFDKDFTTKVTIHNPYVKIDVPKSSFKPLENYWNKFEYDSIDKRKIKTYISLDSISAAENIEHKVFLGRKIIKGYFPVHFFDIDLRSIVKYNNYEGFRLGFGGVTNTKLSNDYKLAIYGAYGLKDQDFKFGITPSYRVNKYSETWLSASYSEDLQEIAETKFKTDIQRFKIYDPRPINVSTFYKTKKSSVFLQSKIIPKTKLYLSLTRNEITPLFNYAYWHNNKFSSKITTSAAKIALEWSPFSSYMQTPLGRLEIEKNHPKFSLQYTQNVPNFLNSDFSFSKFDFKTYYELQYLSEQKSSILLQTGIIIGNAPLTHLYSITPNNVNKSTLLKRITFSGKNSFETMYYNEFFSDKYVLLQLKHTFNRIQLAYKIKPEITIATRMAWGTMNNKNNHLYLPIKTLEHGFYESGVEFNKLFKGLGATFYYRYGAYHLPKFDDNISIKISYYLDLGF